MGTQEPQISPCKGTDICMKTKTNIHNTLRCTHTTFAPLDLLHAVVEINSPGFVFNGSCRASRGLVWKPTLCDLQTAS